MNWQVNKKKRNQKQEKQKKARATNLIKNYVKIRCLKKRFTCAK